MNNLYHKEGLSQSEIADKFNCSDVTISNWMRKLGVEAKNVSKNYTGQKFNKLKLIKRIRKDRTYYVCKCDCGNFSIIRSDSLVSGHTKSCNNCRNKYEFKNGYVIGYDSKGRTFYFDKKYYDLFKNYKWCVTEHGYVSNSENNYMHRMIMLPNNKEEVDHKNRKRNDNREENLRICNRKQNAHNISITNKNKSGVVGVWWDKKRNKWTSQITNDGNKMFLGRFKNKKECIITRLKAEKKYFGEFSPQKHLFEKYDI